eukprot:1345900-Pyramimonas_sp.AAC.1
MFGAATGSRLRELSEHGRFANLWARFSQAGDIGSRCTLTVDERFDPIRDLPTWMPESPSHTGDEVIQGLENAIVKAHRIAAPLDPEFSWSSLGDAIRSSLRRLVEGPATGVALYTISGLHPNQYSIADTPRQPGRLDRKAWSHPGFCCDVELGIDASNLVYNLTWAAL